jgi:murein DD-endopeptidase MepM/ murein hydrolase activator NlpD
MAITINEAIEGLKGSDALIGRPIAARVEEEKPDDNKEIAEKLNAIQRKVVGYLNQANKNIVAFTKQTRNEIRKQDAELLQVSDTVTSVKIAFKGLTEKVHRLEYRVRNLSHKEYGISLTNLNKYKSGLLAAAIATAIGAAIPLILKIIEWFKGKKPSAKSNTDDAQAEKKDTVIPDQTDFKVESNLILIDAGTTIDITVSDTLAMEAKNILLSADEILLESGELLFSTTPIIGDSCEGIANTWEEQPDEDQQTTSEESRKEPAVGGGGGATGGDVPTSTIRSNLNAGIAGATGDLSSQLGIGSIGDRRLSGGGGSTGSGGGDETGHVSEHPPQYDPTKISKDTLFDPISSKNFMGGVGGDSASRGHGAHQGEDWGAPVGTPVYAVRDGCIVRHSRDNFGKLVVVIRHDDGTYTRDMHLQEGSALPVGTRVKGGQQYANSGTANGVPHLHHERWSGPPNKSQLLSPSQEAGRSRKDGMVGGQARQGGQIIQPDVAKPTTGQVSDIPAKEVGSQQYASTDEDTSIPENAQLTQGQLPQGQVLSDATPDNVTAGQQYAGLTTTDKSADTAVAARDEKVGTTDAVATHPDQQAPASPAEKGVLKSSPGAMESILRGFFGRPREPALPPIKVDPSSQQGTPAIQSTPAPVVAENPAPTPVEPPTQTPSITPPVDPPKIPETKPAPAPAPAPAPQPPKPAPETEVPATTSNPEQEGQEANAGSYGAPSRMDHNANICII